MGIPATHTDTHRLTPHTRFSSLAHTHTHTYSLSHTPTRMYSWSEQICTRQRQRQQQQLQQVQLAGVTTKKKVAFLLYQLLHLQPIGTHRVYISVDSYL